MADSTACGNQVDSDSDLEVVLDSTEIDVVLPDGAKKKATMIFYTDDADPLTVQQTLKDLMDKIDKADVELGNVTATVVKASGRTVIMEHGNLAAEYDKYLCSRDTYLQLQY